jgi:PAS domain S-box-containing protein
MNDAIKILHLEDESADAEVIKQELKRGNFTFGYLRVRHRSEFEKEMLSFNPDIILASHSAHPFSAMEALSCLKKLSLSTPFIVTTEPIPGEAVDEMIQDGVSDYLFKDHLHRLPLAVLNAYKKSKAEKELRKQQQEIIWSEKKFKVLIENISDAILLLDEKGSITYQSLSAFRISGYSPEDVIGRSIFEFIHSADKEAETEYFKQALLKPGVPTQNSYRIRNKAGEFIWVEGSIANFLHDTNIRSIIINYRDVTERKSAEESLQKSEANLRTIFDNTGIAYVLSNKKFRIMSFNQSAIEIYGKEFKVELKEGDNLLDYLPEERKLLSKERFEKALSGEKVNYELSFQQPGGNNWYNVNMFAVRDKENNLLGFIISSENITARKTIELERTKMLSDIVQHNKDLEQFAYIISHNLRSPVANILGLSTLLNDSPEMDEENFKKCMNGLTLSVKKLDEVIVDLNYILQTRREINEKKESISFSGLINDIKTSINSLIEKEEVRIHTNFIVNTFFTVKSYLYSIFFNLISNSIKYRDPSQQTIIRIKTKKVGNKLIIEFKDNGLGIDLDAHGNNLFGLYKRFHKHVEGKGMGLYMVKTQVEILGGKISVLSEVNKGTAFTVEFED